MQAAQESARIAVWRQHSEIAVVADKTATYILPLTVDDAEPILVDGSAREIWRAIDDWRSIDDVAELLAEAYGVDAAELRPQIEVFLADLVSRAAATWRLEPADEGDPSVP